MMSLPWRAASAVRGAVRNQLEAVTTAATVSRRPLTTDEVIAKDLKYGAHHYHPIPVALTKGEGTKNTNNT